MTQHEFYYQVYTLVATIPAGKVMTYGQIALYLCCPTSSRRVGQAMFHTPEQLSIPAHRVVNSKGEMAPGYVFGGGERQRELLRSEGVAFKKNGCIDLSQSLFR